ncbi:ATP-dependent DNA ligase [Streptomyces chattanoogensis]|uniref:ATP-dependent DNA ligase n=1 Tax=Streptomyces chattanoogensis TaxID=66876 RepID=UPI00369F26BB
MPLRLPVTVALAEAATELPAGPGWAYEPKFDGHRVCVICDADGAVHLQAGRSQRDVTAYFPDLAAAAESLPDGTVLDGEAVIYRAGVIDFTAVQQRALSKPARARHLASELTATYAAFDVLEAHGRDMRGKPYQERRRLLTALLEPLAPSLLQPVPMTEDVEEARVWMDALRAQGIEGIVAKRVRERYPAGRRSWVKVRHATAMDAVAVGFTGPASRPARLVVDVGGGRLLLSAPLGVAISRVLAQALEVVGGRGGVAWIRDGRQYRGLSKVLPVEVEMGTTRHPTVTVRRLRPDLG